MSELAELSTIETFTVSNANFVEERLIELELSLPEVSTPGGNYQSVNVRNDTAFVAIQFPIIDGPKRYRGKLGLDLSTEEGYHAMQLCALNVLSQIKHKVGFENIEGLNHIDIYYQSVNTWDDAPLVANGASDLFVKVLGKTGTHSRSLIGAAILPRNYAVGLVCSFSLKRN